MSPLRSILLLATVACAVLVPMFIGHALALHVTKPILYAMVLLVIAAALAFLGTRPAGRSGAG